MKKSKKEKAYEMGYSFSGVYENSIEMQYNVAKKQEFLDRIKKFKKEGYKVLIISESSKTRYGGTDRGKSIFIKKK